MQCIKIWSFWRGLVQIDAIQKIFYASAKILNEKTAAHPIHCKEWPIQFTKRKSSMKENFQEIATKREDAPAKPTRLPDA